MHAVHENNLPNSPSGEQHVQTTAVVNMDLARKENPTRNHELSLPGKRGKPLYQFSGRKMTFAECTKHGSAWFGEFRILREYSLEEDITMKLENSVSLRIQMGKLSYMLKTLRALRAPDCHCFW